MSLRISARQDGIYRIRGTVQGIRFDQSARTRVRSEAQAIADKLAKEAFDSAVYGPRKVATFMQAVEGYLGAGGDPTHLTPLLVEFGRSKLSEVNQVAIDRYARTRAGVSPATLVRQIYTPMSAVMRFASRQGLCDRPEYVKPKVKSGRTDFLTPDQAEAWLKVLPPYLASLFTFYLATGCRATEAITLDWRDVSIDSRRVTFWDTKGGYPRGVDLIDRARAVLPERAEGLVFLNSRGEPWHGYDAINLMFRRHRERHPKLAPVHCHLLRHTWATWNYAVEPDLTFMMASGGWRSPTMVMRYAHASSDDLADAAIKANWIGLGRLKKRGRSGGRKAK